MFGDSFTTARGIARSLTFDDRPLIVFWEVTKACSLACAHCRAKARPRPAPGELTTEEGLRLVEEIARFGSPTPRLVLTGGDPLERGDLVALVTEATARGIPVAVAPAASPRLTRAALDELKSAGAWGVAVSIDFAEETAHDAFRRSPGSFARACAAVRDARELGLWTQVNSVALRDNIEALPRLFSLVKEIGAHAWEVIPLIPTGRAARLPQLTPGEMDAVLHFLEDAGKYGVRVHAAETPASRRVALQRRAKGAKPPDDPLYAKMCAALTERHGEPLHETTPLGQTRSGAGVVFVSADGAVMPSGFLPLPVGNVRDERLTDLYRLHPLFQALRDTSRFKGPCGLCVYSEACGGSRARAFAATGDALGSDPSCPLATS